MALDTCNVHMGVKANARCKGCLKPMCPQCQVYEGGCCSDRCGKATTRFNKDRVPELHKPNPIWAVLQFALVIGLIYGVLKYLGYVK